MQFVPKGEKVSNGHTSETPLQNSGTSHCDCEARHCTVLLKMVTPGHVLVRPLQSPFVEHCPSDVAQRAPEGKNPFAGHSQGCAAKGSHCSAISQVPFTALHVVELPKN